MTECVGRIKGDPTVGLAIKSNMKGVFVIAHFSLSHSWIYYLGVLFSQRS